VCNFTRQSCNAGLPGLEPVVLTASLKHHFEAVGGNIVQITFEDTEVKVTGGIGGLLVSTLALVASRDAALHVCMLGDEFCQGGKPWLLQPTGHCDMSVITVDIGTATHLKCMQSLFVLQGNLPEIMLPQLPEFLKPSRQQRTSSFDVLYLDSDMRIIRGSRGELRIFIKT